MSIVKESRPSRHTGRWAVIGMLCAGAGLGTAGCTAAAGAGVAAVAVGAAIATSECYGYVDVLVTDGVTGGRACDANVSAARGDDVVPFTSCFYAPLTEGRWRLAVEKPGYQSVTSEIQVDPQEHCERVVHYISVRLDSLSAPPANAWNARPPAAAPVPAAPPVAAPPPAPAGATPVAPPSSMPSPPDPPPILEVAPGTTPGSAPGPAPTASPPPPTAPGSAPPPPPSAPPTTLGSTPPAASP